MMNKQDIIILITVDCACGHGLHVNCEGTVVMGLGMWLTEKLFTMKMMDSSQLTELGLEIIVRRFLAF